MTRMHPSDCKDCEELKNSDHGPIDIIGDGKEELKHGENCNDCVRMYGKKKLHYLNYDI